jgi:hypothetical protein
MIPQTLPCFGTRSFVSLAFVSLAPLAIDYGVNEVSRLANMAVGFSEIKQSD